MTFDKAQREEIAEAVTVGGHRRVPVEALEGVLVVESGLREANAQVLVIAPVDLVLQDEPEEVELGDFLFGT